MSTKPDPSHNCGGAGQTSYGRYTYAGSGTNAQGNHHCTRDYGAGTSNSYHYSNADGSYYYSNPNGSK